MLEKRCRFDSPDAAVDFRAVIAGGLGKQPGAVHHCAAFRVLRTIIKPGDPRVGNRTGAHRAGLQRDPQVAIAETVSLKTRGRLTQREDFGMGRRVMRPRRRICPASDDLSVQRDHGANRNPATRSSFSGDSEGFGHGMGQGKGHTAI